MRVQLADINEYAAQQYHEFIEKAKMDNEFHKILEQFRKEAAERDAQYQRRADEREAEYQRKEEERAAETRKRDEESQRKQEERAAEIRKRDEEYRKKDDERAAVFFSENKRIQDRLDNHEFSFHWGDFINTTFAKCSHVGIIEMRRLLRVERENLGEQYEQGVEHIRFAKQCKDNQIDAKTLYTMQENRNQLCHPLGKIDIKETRMELENIKNKITPLEFDILEKGILLKTKKHEKNVKRRSKRRS